MTKDRVLEVLTALVALTATKDRVLAALAALPVLTSTKDRALAALTAEEARPDRWTLSTAVSTSCCR